MRSSLVVYYRQHAARARRRLLVPVTVRGADGGRLEYRGAAQTRRTKPAASDGGGGARGQRTRFGSRDPIRGGPSARVRPSQLL